MLVVFLVITVLPLHGWTRTEVATVIPVQQEEVVSCAGWGGSQLAHHPQCDPRQVWAGGSELQEGGNGLQAALLNQGLGMPSWALELQGCPSQKPPHGLSHGRKLCQEQAEATLLALPPLAQPPLP